MKGLSVLLIVCLICDLLSLLLLAWYYHSPTKSNIIGDVTILAEINHLLLPVSNQTITA